MTGTAAWAQNFPVTPAQKATATQVAQAGGAGIRQRQPAATAHEQRQADVVLEQPDLVADRGGGDPEFGRGLRNAHVPGGHFEGPQGIEGREGTSHESPTKLVEI